MREGENSAGACFDEAWRGFFSVASHWRDLKDGIHNAVKVSLV
jgi:hypothetical protein